MRHPNGGGDRQRPKATKQHLGNNFLYDEWVYTKVEQQTEGMANKSYAIRVVFRQSSSDSA